MAHITVFGHDLCLDTSTQGEYTKLKPALKNFKDFNGSKRQSQILPLRPETAPSYQTVRATSRGWVRLRPLSGEDVARTPTRRDGQGGPRYDGRAGTFLNSSVITIASATLTTMTKPPRFEANNTELLGALLTFG